MTATTDAAEKIGSAHEQISGVHVARMILNFHTEFNGIYGLDTMHSSLCAVGPLQAMIGLAIKDGLLAPLPIDVSPPDSNPFLKER